MWPPVGEPLRVCLVGGIKVGLTGSVDPLALAGVTISDAERASEIFELLMGNDVAPRRDFIVSSASRVNKELLDT